MTKAQMHAMSLGIRMMGQGLLQVADALSGAATRKTPRREPPEVEGEVDPAVKRGVAMRLREIGRKVG